MTETWKWWRDDYQKNVILAGPVSAEDGKQTRVRIWHMAPDQVKVADDVVLAVNSHDKLVEALEGLVEWDGDTWRIDSAHPNDCDERAQWDASIAKAKAALAEAKEGTTTVATPRMTVTLPPPAQPSQPTPYKPTPEEIEVVCKAVK